MTLEELLAALDKLPEGSKFAEALKAIIAAKEAEIAEASTKTKTGSKAQKELEKKLKATEEKLAKVFDTLGIDEDDDLETAIADLNKNTKTKGDEVLLKRLEKLEKARKAEKETLEQQLNDERGKRHNATKRQELLKALTENNAARPEDLVDMLFGKVEIGDDDSLSFADEKGGSVKVGDGVKGWLSSRPEFVKNSQNPGGGSNANPFKTPSDKDGKPLSLGASLAKQTADNTKVAFDAQTHFFGGSAQ